ncbi:hypothetical protein FDA94_11755 [Herbidospora galbida]|uniref:Uncharacterized protein n=1 Tax=Herbidospora galbida TaxID=2575442 RepID=A0A4U3MJ94_9ACTN|nr:hypothetical protein [Herbidospora galbida]TKK88759.1 hypothetical protein FDA94_11755 [Herbidospora galbida]
MNAGTSGNSPPSSKRPSAELRLVVPIWNGTLLLADVEAIDGSGPLKEAFVAPGRFAGATDNSLTALSDFNTRHSDLILQRWSEEPPLDVDSDSDSAELSVRLASGKVAPHLPVGGAVHEHIDLGAPGLTWRLRVLRHPTGVPDDYDDDEDDPIDETFVFQFWPA